jgi:cobalt-zinc-cadmium efflux system membrane fusion protein
MKIRILKSFMSLIAISTMVLLTITLAACGEEAPSHNADRDHDEHEQDEDHDEHEDDNDAVHLSDGEMNEFGIVIKTVGPGTLKLNIALPGEVVLNPDKVAHVAPRVSGVTRTVHKSVGDKVSQGEQLAVLDSREFARSKAAFLAALARERLAEANYRREAKLWEDEITSEKSLLEAKQALEEERIARKLAERELHALGLDEQDVTALAHQSEVQYTRYEMLAPIGGTVIERHLVRGEMVKEDTDKPAFIIADLSSVWVNLSVYTKDIGHVSPGAAVTIQFDEGLGSAESRIDYISPIVDKQTRTATARAVLANPEGRYRPGLFVTAHVSVAHINVPMAVPHSAIQMVEDQPSIFIQDEDGFQLAIVRLGQKDGTHTEILSGLKPGDSYVASGGFLLKSEMLKSELEHAGHAH